MGFDVQASPAGKALIAFLQSEGKAPGTISVTISDINYLLRFAVGPTDIPAIAAQYAAAPFARQARLPTSWRHLRMAIARAGGQMIPLPEEWITRAQSAPTPNSAPGNGPPAPFATPPVDDPFATQPIPVSASVTPPPTADMFNTPPVNAAFVSTGKKNAPEVPESHGISCEMLWTAALRVVGGLERKNGGRMPLTIMSKLRWSAFIVEGGENKRGPFSGFGMSHPNTPSGSDIARSSFSEAVMDALAVLVTWSYGMKGIPSRELPILPDSPGSSTPMSSTKLKNAELEYGHLIDAPIPPRTFLRYVAPPAGWVPPPRKVETRAPNADDAARAIAAPAEDDDPTTEPEAVTEDQYAGMRAEVSAIENLLTHATNPDGTWKLPTKEEALAMAAEAEQKAAAQAFRDAPFRKDPIATAPPTLTTHPTPGEGDQ